MFTAYRYKGPDKTGKPQWQKVLVEAEDHDPNFLWIKNSAAQREATRVMFSMIYCAEDDKGHRATFNWKAALAEKAAKDSAVKQDDDKKTDDKQDDPPAE